MSVVLCRRCYVATRLLSKLHGRQLHRNYRPCWHPPPLKGDHYLTDINMILIHRSQYSIWGIYSTDIQWNKPLCQGDNHICVTSIDCMHEWTEARFILLVQIKINVCRLPAPKIEEFHQAFLLAEPANNNKIVMLFFSFNWQLVGRWQFLISVMFMWMTWQPSKEEAPPRLWCLPSEADPTEYWG